MDKNLYQNYHQNAIMSAGPEELVTMLYNRLLKDLKLGIISMDKKDLEATHKSLVHAQEILVHLMGTLNTEFEIGKGLLLMYDYMNRRLTEANIKKDSEMIREVMGYIEEIKDAWVQAVRRVKTSVAVGD